MQSRIMYIENKSESLSGEARIGKVTFSRTMRSMFYQGKEFAKLKAGINIIVSNSNRATNIGYQDVKRMALTDYMVKANLLKLMKMLVRSIG